MDELVEIVDADDRVLRTATVRACHGEQPQPIHRAAFVQLMLPDGRLVLQLRAPGMPFPGKLTCTASGHVDAGESYEQAAARELWEEAGVRPLLHRAGFVRSHHPVHMLNITVFTGTAAGALRNNPEEVTSFPAFAREELAQLLRAHPDRFTPGCRDVLRFLGIG